MSIFHTTIVRRALPYAVIAAFAACEKPQPRVYRQPKELPPPPEPREEPPAPRQDDVPAAPQPRVTYAAPSSWKETGPDRLSVARFAVEAGGGVASVNITPLPSMVGHDTDLINMWRGQVGQSQLSEEQAAKALKEVEIGGAKGRQFEVAGKNDGKDLRIVTAYLHQGERSWFFKLQGDGPAVEATMPAFAEFLKSVKFEEPAAPAPKPSPPPALESPASSAPPAPAVAGDTPAGWTSAAPGQMQAKKFNVAGKDGANAEVTVSIFPGDTGGNVANVKRWRGQIGLPNVDDAAIQSSLKPVEGLEGAVIVDLENGDRAMTGAIVPRGGQYYFYKLMGSPAAVSAAREAFVGYVMAKP